MVKYSSEIDIAEATDRGGSAKLNCEDSLSDWDADHEESFLIAYVIDQQAADHLMEGMHGDFETGITKVECPFGCGSHVTACNPGVVEKRWTVTCDHKHCEDRTSLEFFEKMLNEDWFEDGFNLLFDERCHNKNWRAVVERSKSRNVKPKPKLKSKVDEPLSLSQREAEERVEAAGFEKGGKQGPIRDFIDDLLNEDPDIATQGYVTGALVAATGLGTSKINHIFKLARDALRIEERSNGKVPIIGEWDDSEMVAYAEHKISKAKDHHGDPLIYLRYGDYCVINDGNIDLLTLPQFRARLNDITKWENAKRGVLAPKEIAEQCYHRDGKPGAELSGVKKTAHYDANWHRVDQHGYNAATGVYLASDGLDVPPVSKDPVEDEVAEAKRLFVEEVFGDFPIGGLTRKELVPKVMSGEAVPDAANLIGMCLQPFCRDGIDGPDSSVSRHF